MALKRADRWRNLTAILSLFLVVQWLPDAPVDGSIALFIASAVVYQFSVTALGILLATLSASVPQIALLTLSMLVAMYLLSGGMTPLESMLVWLQNVMQIVSSTHFVAFSQAVLYRGAGLGFAWPQFLALVVIGGACFPVSLIRSRKVQTTLQ